MSRHHSIQLSWQSSIRNREGPCPEIATATKDEAAGAGDEPHGQELRGFMAPYSSRDSPSLQKMNAMYEGGGRRRRGAPSFSFGALLPFALRTMGC